MSGALGPKASIWHTGAAGGWLILCGCWAPIGGLGILWLSAKLAAALTGGQVNRFGLDFALAIAHNRADLAWPGTPTPLVLFILVVLVAGAGAAVWVIWQKVTVGYPQPGDPVAALAGNPGLEPLKPVRADSNRVAAHHHVGPGTRPARLPTRPKRCRAPHPGAPAAPVVRAPGNLPRRVRCVCWCPASPRHGHVRWPQRKAPPRSAHALRPHPGR
jgi:hypothetical protein